MSNFIDPTLLGRSSTAAAPQQQQHPNGDGPTTAEEVGMGEAGPSDAPQTQEMHQKDQELAQLLLQLDDYAPLIPDPVISYYLERVGFQCADPRVKRLLALACQKFVADIAQDAFSFARTRAGQAPGGGRAGAGAGPTGAAGPTGGAGPSKKDRAKTTLTQEDLAQALAEFGINASRAPYYL